MLAFSHSQIPADVAIVDLELAALSEVQQLKREFAATTIVCTHRLADETMWANALAAGAADCCYASDVRAIVLAASNTKPLLTRTPPEKYCCTLLRLKGASKRCSNF